MYCILWVYGHLPFTVLHLFGKCTAFCGLTGVCRSPYSICLANVLHFVCKQASAWLLFPFRGEIRGVLPAVPGSVARRARDVRADEEPHAEAQREFGTRAQRF